MQHEVARFGMAMTGVNPRGFRTELLEQGSATDAERRRRPDDPAMLARALVTIAGQPAPLRVGAGADAVALAERKAKELLARLDTHHELSASLALEDA